MAGPASGRRLRVPGWLIEVARAARGPVPWAQMGFTALAVGAPLAAGLTAGQLGPGVLVAMGGLGGALADQIGPYPMRMRRIAATGVLGGAAGLLLGTAIHHHGWLAVGVLVVLAGLSAVLSSISATWSTIGLNLLVYAALGTGPLGAVQPWWLPPLWLVAGVCWSLVLMVPGWILRPRAVEQHRVAAVYRALAADLHALGTEGFDATRRDVAAALDVAYEELVSQRAAVRGQDRRLTRLVALLNQARLAEEASAALAYAGEQPPPEAALQADALAEAVQDGRAVPEIDRPAAADPAVLTLCGALNGAADVVSGRGGVLSGAAGGAWSTWEGRRLLAALAEKVRGGFTSTFVIRLMLCIGVAAVFSEVLPLQRSYWVVLAVAVIMKPDFGSVFARALQYGAGTVLGAAAGALILAAGPPELVLLASVVLFAALLPYGMSRNYALFAVFFTALIVLLIDALTHSGWPLAHARLIDALLGCGIALGIGYAPWPSSWHVGLRRDYAAGLDTAARYLDRALGQGARDISVSARTQARRQVAALHTAFQRSLAGPRRVRQGVTAWWPALVALEQLLDAIAATAVTAVGQPPPATAVSEVSAALRQIAASVRSGKPPDQRLPSPPSIARVTDAVRSVQHSLAETPPL